MRLPVLAGNKRTEHTNRMTKTDTKVGALLYPERDYWRPRTRADCAQVPRPCPYVGCRYNLYLDVSPERGSITRNYSCEVWDAAHTCALDLAEEGGATLDRVGEIMGLTRERVRQVELVALRKLPRDQLPHPDDVEHHGGPIEPSADGGHWGRYEFSAQLTRKMRERFVWERLQFAPKEGSERMTG